MHAPDCMARLIGIPAVREWLIKTTGFLGGLFPTPLYLLRFHI